MLTPSPWIFNACRRSCSCRECLVLVKLFEFTAHISTQADQAWKDEQLTTFLKRCTFASSWRMLACRCWFDLSHCNNNREKTTEMAKECQSCKPFCWNFGKVFFDSAVVFFGKHLRYESVLSPSCHPVLMINVKLSDRIPVPMSLRGDER